MLKSASGSLGASAFVDTWANRGIYTNPNSIVSVFFSDVGVGGGSFWYYSGSKWRPYGGRVTLKNTITNITNSAAPKIVMDSCTLLPGLWQDGDILHARIYKERTGGTSDTDATDLMLGTVAGTLGTSLGLVTAALATTSISLAVDYRVLRASATSVTPLSIGGGVGLGASTTAFPAVTVSNIDSNTLYLQTTSDLTTAGGEVANLRNFTVELIIGT
jgi:hypothetical protein